MKIITRYEANDGKIFKTPEEGFKYERLLEEMKEILSLLPPEPPFESGWANGKVYVQCDMDNVTRAKTKFRALYNKEFDRIGESFSAISGRLLDDSGSPLYGLWSHLTWIDETNRWWGQAYYMLHPTPDAPEYKGG
jgi:hypothetical protein